MGQPGEVKGRRGECTIRESGGNTMPATVEPFRETLTADELRTTFEELAEAWRNRTRYQSFIQKLVTAPEYQRIIGLGRPVVPLLLRDLEREPEFWFWALECITGENPVPESALGDIDAMSAAWVDWGYRHGVLGRNANT
jgi:hypothetical protein